MSESITELCERHGAVVPLERERGNICPWCDGPTRPRKHRGGKPKGKYRRLTDDQVRAAHTLYVGEKLSLRRLGSALYERFGYSSAQSCANSLHAAFKDLGLPRRERIEAVQLGCTTHGMCRRGQKRPPEYNALRNARRPKNPMCAGVRQNHPRKGEPCTLHAQHGSDYCWAHDPAHAEARNRHLEDMRSWIGL